LIQCANDEMDSVALKLDAAGKIAEISDSDDPGWSGRLTLTQPTTQLLSIQGAVNGSDISVRLHRLDESKLPLTSRGFHWINEHPF